jgi:tetratricopeptide (TPR) repeat protein
MIALMAAMMVIPVMETFAASESSAKKHLKRAQFLQMRANAHKGKSDNNEKYFESGSDYIKKAYKYYKSKKYDKSISYSRKAMSHFGKVDKDSDGSNASQRSNAGKANVAIDKAQKEYNRARRVYEKSYGKPEGASSYKKGMAYLYRAKRYKKKQDYDNAIKYAKKATVLLRKVR